SRARCAAYSGLPAGFRRDELAGMVWIEGGRVVPGSEDGYAEERPRAPVDVEGFWIDRTEVTNAQFAAFVEATGYVTLAERRGGSAVFRVPTAEELARTRHAWRYEPKASWRKPDASASARTPRPHEPVVHVAYEDALAYARWLGRELPSEAQWEFAARARGGDHALDGPPRDAKGRAAANTWQGDFPLVNRAEDGFASRAPVGCFPGNPLGLFDMIGNVWEWTRDPSPTSPDEAPAPGAPVARVIKGGSFLCAPTHCARFRASARQFQDEDLPTSHIGFRTVKSGPRPAR